MLKSSLVVIAGSALILLAAMGIVQYVEVSYSTEDAISISYAVGPVAFILWGLFMGLTDDWRYRLANPVEREFCGF